MQKSKKIAIITTIFTLLLWTGCQEEQSNTTEQSTQSTQPKISNKPFIDHVKWVKDLDTAFKLGKEQQKNIIVMVDSKGCRWCIRMEHETFNDPKILEKFKNYIMVKVSREDPKSRSRLPEFKHVPIMFFYKWDGELIDNLRGFYQAPDLLGYIQELEEYLE